MKKIARIKESRKAKRDRFLEESKTQKDPRLMYDSSVKSRNSNDIS